MKMTLSTRNARGIVANLFASDARAQRAIRKEVKASKNRVEKGQKARAPVRTGFTKRAITSLLSDDGLAYESGVKEETYAAAGLPFYAIYQEFGTLKMPAQPFIFPPLREETPVFRRNLSKAVRDAMRRRS